MQPRKGNPRFTFRGVTIDLNWWSILLIGVGSLMWSDDSATVTILLVIGAVASILLHDLVVALVGTWLGASISGIRSSIVDGGIFYERKPDTLSKSILRLLCGPATYLVLWQLFSLGSFKPGLSNYYANLIPFSQPYGYEIATANYYLAMFNLVLGVLNLLPWFPFDGGDILYFVLYRWLKPSWAVNVSIACTVVVAGLVFFTPLTQNAGFDLRIEQFFSLTSLPFQPFGSLFTLLLSIFILLCVLAYCMGMYNLKPDPYKPTATYANANGKAGPVVPVQIRPAVKIFEEGRSALLRNDWLGAVSAFSQAMQTDPQEMAYLEYRAYTFSTMGNYPQALTDYNALLGLYPQRADFYLSRAQTYQRMGNLTAAQQDVAASLQLNPTYNQALAFRGFLNR